MSESGLVWMNVSQWVNLFRFCYTNQIQKSSGHHPLEEIQEGCLGFQAWFGDPDMCFEEKPVTVYV